MTKRSKKGGDNAAQSTENQTADSGQAASTETTAAAAPAEAKPSRPKQNGITRPEPGSATGKLWDIADRISAEMGRPAPRKAVVDAYKREQPNANEATANTQYARWVQYWGVSKELASLKEADAKARQEAAEAERANAEAARKAERDQKAQARADEKKRRADEKAAAKAAKEAEKAAANQPAQQAA